MQEAIRLNKQENVSHFSKDHGALTVVGNHTVCLSLG